MVIPERYLVRMFNIPDTMTKRELDEQFISRDLKYSKIFFASQNGTTSAGFAFIEFDSREDMNIFKIHFNNVGEDILYNNGTLL